MKKNFSESLFVQKKCRPIHKDKLNKDPILKYINYSMIKLKNILKIIKK